MSSATAWAANALWPGDAIVARLRNQVPDLRVVLAIDEFDPAQTQPRQLPAAVVLLDHLRVKGSNAMRQEATIEQDWLVVLALRSAARAPGGNAAQAGALIPAVVAALLGFKPDGGARAIEWRTGPRPDYGSDVSYFPLLFSIQAVAA